MAGKEREGSLLIHFEFDPIWADFVTINKNYSLLSII